MEISQEKVYAELYIIHSDIYHSSKIQNNPVTSFTIWSSFQSIKATSITITPKQWDVWGLDPSNYPTPAKQGHNGQWKSEVPILPLDWVVLRVGQEAQDVSYFLLSKRLGSCTEKSSSLSLQFLHGAQWFCRKSQISFTYLPFTFTIFPCTILWPFLQSLVHESEMAIPGSWFWESVQLLGKGRDELLMVANDWIIETEQRAAGINNTWGTGQLGWSKKGRREEGMGYKGQPQVLWRTWITTEPVTSDMGTTWSSWI